MVEKPLQLAHNNLLSDSSKKLNLYFQDIYFYEAWSEINDFLLDRVDEYLVNYTAVVFKPDAFAYRIVDHAISLLNKHGFIPVACKTFTYNRQIIRDAWRYQINIATTQRLKAVDLLLRASESLLILFKDLEATPSLTASKRMSMIKGPAQLIKRKPYHIRSHLGQHNGLLNKIHVPDEAADLLRELVIYLEREDRLPMYDLSELQITEDEIRRKIARIQNTVPFHHMSPDKILQEIEIELLNKKRFDYLYKEHSEKIINIIKKMANDEIADWESLFKLLDKVNIRLSTWDKIVIATQFTQVDRPGVEPIL